jgi:hypothetical protein
VVWSRCGAAAQLFFGILLGWGAGYITCVLLRFVYNDKLIEASIIIAFTFLTFWAGELATGASAVIAVVVMGLYVNFHKSAVSNEVLHFLHEFYEMVAHALNTVIFAIAGLKMSTFFLDYSMNVVMPDSLGGSGSIFKIGFMGIFSVLVARGVAIGVVWPVLRRLGTGCTWQEAVVLWWGGLRGSVGLALALSIHHTIYDGNMWNPSTGGWDTTGTMALPCRDIPHGILVITVFIIVFTVVVNGMSMRILMNRLRLTELTDERRFMLKLAYEKLEKSSKAYFEAQKKKKPVVFRDIKWEQVQPYQISAPPDFKADEVDQTWIEPHHPRPTSSALVPDHTLLHLLAHQPCPPRPCSGRSRTRVSRRGSRCSTSSAHPIRCSSRRARSGRRPSPSSRRSWPSSSPTQVRRSRRPPSSAPPRAWPTCAAEARTARR